MSTLAKFYQIIFKMEQIDYYINKASLHFDQFEFLRNLSVKLNCRTGHLVIGFVGLLIILALFDVFSGIICDMVFVIYPGYMSFKAIETKATDDDKQWLTYWVIYASLKLVEAFLDVLIFWIPFYGLIKLGFLVWLVWPESRGALLAYENVVRPLLMKHEKQIDDTLADLNRKVDEARHIVDDKVVTTIEP